MRKLETPLLIAPVLKPKIWGRRTLAPVFGEPADDQYRVSSRQDFLDFPPVTGGLIGEAWLTGESSRFLNGPVAGLTLAEVSEKYGKELHGSIWPHRSFPILAKYLFTSDWLSVQVHPDDDYARLHHPGNFGKAEMWYIVQADGAAEFLLGLRPGATVENLRTACERGTSRKLLRRFRPRAKEAVFVPPGAVHALGPGLVLFEAEQNSDLTYRLDDFGRAGLEGKPRPLHLKQGLDVARFEQPPHRNLPRLQFREPFGSKRYIVACPFFAVEELILAKSAAFESSPRRVEVLSILSGHGRMETSKGWMGFFRGDTWLIPPGAGRYRLAPRRTTRILKCYVPDLDKDFREPLGKKRVKAGQLEKIIFA